MITRITGKLLRVDGLACTLSPGAPASSPAGSPSQTSAGTAHAPTDGAFEYEVLVPAYVAARMADRIGQVVSFSTLHYLEGHGQGTSFLPRLIGFPTRQERDFFELFTTVKGIGNRKALRALTVEPAVIAGAIAGKEPKTLQQLPEIGRRLAETIIAELAGKVEAHLSTGERSALDRAALGGLSRASGRSPSVEQAIDALVALGESRPEAERTVELALARAGGAPPATADEVLSLVYAAR